MGYLSGKFDPDTPDATSRQNAIDFIPFDRAKGARVLECLHDLAVHHRVTPSRIALAWLLSKQAVTSIILGATKFQHLDDSLKAGDIELAPDEIARLDDISRQAQPYPLWCTSRTRDMQLYQALGMGLSDQMRSR
jgi:aryl-alcohol dehydrogenase-like predicted oxidoreductase